MSVDLVGSTSYKSKAGSHPDGTGADPRWVKQIKHFYQDFPAQIRINYKAKSSAIAEDAYAALCPHVWKTVGDEIILCCRVVDMQHAFLCVQVFAQTLRNYGYWLDNQSIELDVKGSAWLAAFPNPNITVLVNKNGAVDADTFSGSSDEELELQADSSPSDFDFLGNSIDAGFRIAKYAERDKLILSLELAYIISYFSHLKSEIIKLYLVGKFAIKGVLGDRPYPIIAIDAERNPDKRRLRTKEENLRPKINSDPIDYSEYTELFLRDARMDVPALAVDHLDGAEIDPPQSYQSYMDRWEKEELASSKSDDQRAEGESEEAAKGAGNLNIQQESFLEVFERLFKGPLGAASSPSKPEKQGDEAPTQPPSDTARRSKPGGGPRAKPSRQRKPRGTSR